MTWYPGDKFFLDARQRGTVRRRGPVRGFVANGKTHAALDDLNSGPLGRCGTVPNGSGWTPAPFIANPKAPLCLACVSDIEDEIRRK